MSIGLRKAWADLRAGWREWLLAVAALALGLWGVASIVIANAILRSDLRANFAQTRPAHAVLVSDDFGQVNLSAVRALAGVESAEWRDFALLRIEVHPDEWIPLWLFGVRDFDNMRIARVRGYQDAFPPPPGSMLIERDGRRISDLDRGSIARVRAGPRVLQVPISGIAFDPGQAPATQDHYIYAYADAPTFAQLTGSASGHRLLVRFAGVHSREDVRRHLELLQAQLTAQGVTLRSTVLPPFEEHPHQWQLNTLLLLQGAMGFLAFLMGAILVAQLMAALLAKQVRQIAILKAIGATYGQLLSLYSAMLAVLGAVAGSVALPLAWISGVAFSFFVGAKLNFDIHPYNVPSITFQLLALVSLLMPILVSLPVLRSALSAPVRQGLGEYGLVVRAPNRCWRLPQFLGTALAMALRNAARQRRRAVVTVIAMAVGVAIFDSGFNVREALSNMLTDASSSMTHDVQVVLNQSVPRSRALSPFRALPGVRAIETWNGGRGELQTRIVAADGGVGVVALPRDTALFHPRIVAGHWLRTNELTELVINQQAAELLGHPSVGTELTIHLHGQPLRGRLVGIIEELEKPKIYLDRDDYDRAANPEHFVNSVMFVAEHKDSASVMALKRKVESAVAKSDLDVLYVMSQAERVKILVDHLDIVLTVLVGLSFVVLAVSAFGMASATGIKMRERTRELGVLRAIGATPAVIMRLVTLEGMVVSGISILLGLVLAQPLSREAAVSFGRLMLGEEASLRYAFSASGLLIVVAVTLAFSLLASWIPAHGALRMAPRDALMFA